MAPDGGVVEPDTGDFMMVAWKTMGKPWENHRKTIGQP